MQIKISIIISIKLPLNSVPWSLEVGSRVTSEELEAPPPDCGLVWPVDTLAVVDGEWATKEDSTWISLLKSTVYHIDQIRNQISKNITHTLKRISTVYHMNQIHNQISKNIIPAWATGIATCPETTAAVWLGTTGVKGARFTFGSADGRPWDWSPDGKMRKMRHVKLHTIILLHMPNS